LKSHGFGFIQGFIKAVVIDTPADLEI